MDKKSKEKRATESLKELHLQNYEAIQAYKVKLEELVISQAELSRIIGNPIIAGLTWRELADAISEMPYECQMLEAVIIIDNGSGEWVEPLKLSISEIEDSSLDEDDKTYSVNCCGDFTSSMPHGNYLR